MSTTYGKIKLRDSSEMEVEAFGVTHCVKLVHPVINVEIDDPVQVRSLITLLQIAYDHIWTDDEAK